MSSELAFAAPLVAPRLTTQRVRSETRSEPKGTSTSPMFLLGTVGAAGAAACRGGRGLRRGASRWVTAVARPATMVEAPPTTYAAGQKLHGWTCVRSEYIKEFGCTGYVFEHDKTGAELLSMVQPADENKTFSVVFRTPPENSNGIAHVLEHSVLCGSRKYPLKEPFVELMKSSLQTFLNAMTFPDRTCYPVASCNLKDFYNLIDVYLDAVFFPRALKDPRVLAQEGWHYEIEDKEQPLTFKGVVFNEMKGVYSNPDAAHGRTANQSMFPDNQYGVDSGGDPKEIPNLTFDYFKDLSLFLFRVTKRARISTASTTTRPTPSSGSTVTTPPMPASSWWTSTSASSPRSRCGSCLRVPDGMRWTPRSMFSPYGASRGRSWTSSRWVKMKTSPRRPW